MFEDSEEVRQFYRARYVTKGLTPEGMAWTDAETHYRRLYSAEMMLKLHRPDELKSARMLDVGCGYGLLPFLWGIEYRPSVIYHGVDLVDEYIDEARHKFATRTNMVFTCCDFMQYGMMDQYDVVLAIGTFAWQSDEAVVSLINRCWEATAPEGTLIFTYLPGAPLADGVVRWIAKELDAGETSYFTGYAKTPEVMVGWRKK